MFDILIERRNIYGNVENDRKYWKMQEFKLKLQVGTD